MSALPPDEVLEALDAELEAALGGGATLDAAAVAARHGVAVTVVEACLASRQALAAGPGPGDALRRATAGRYELRGLLGCGGMGAVYRAQDLRLGRAVAVKVLVANELGSTHQRTRFLREARAAALLEHPNAAAIHDLIEAEGRLYLVQQLIKGARTFAEVAPELPWRARVRALRDASRALGEAHRLGLIHRDVKPQNLLIDERGRAYVVDFGLARPVEAESLTASGTILGTMGYLAPEQATGSPRGHGPPADVWSLGVVLYEALTGRHPLSETPLEYLGSLARRQAPPPLRRFAPELPAALEAVCARALAFAPEQRQVDGHALADDLDRVLDESARGPRRPPWRLLACGAISFLLGGWAHAALVGAAPRAPLGAPPTPPLAAPGMPPTASAPAARLEPIVRVRHVDARGPVGVAWARDGSLVTYGLAGLRRWSLDGEPLGSWLPGRVSAAVGLREGDWVFLTPRLLVRRPVLRRGLSSAPGPDWTISAADATHLAATPSARTLAFGGDALGVFVVSSEEGTPQLLEGPRPDASLHLLLFLDESHLVVLRRDGVMSELAVWSHERRLRERSLSRPAVSALAAAPDGRSIALGYVSGRLALYEAERLEELRPLADQALPPAGEGPGGRAFAGAVGALAFAPDGAGLLAAPGPDVPAADLRLKRFELATGAARALTPPLSGAPSGLAPAPDGAHVALGMPDGQAEVWPSDP